MGLRIVTLSGASGVGKSTIVQGVSALLPKVVRLVTSTTTRLPRASDLDGEYEYVTRAEFENLQRDDKFLWWVSVTGEFYGTKKYHVDSLLKGAGIIGLMPITPETVLLLKTHLERNYPRCDWRNVYSFYIIALPDVVLRERMQKRGDNPADTERRLQECHNWDKWARNACTPGGLGVFNEFITNESSPNVAIAYVAQTILHFRGK